MNNLHSLKNTTRPHKNTKCLGRGPGSGRGKTSGRGQKGAGSRSGYKRRFGTEGGQLPLYRKLPTRGFSNARFRKPLDTINLYQIDNLYNDGDVVSMETLREHRYLSGESYGIKVLAEGELTKKVTIAVTAISESAKEKLNKAGISFTTEK